MGLPKHLSTDHDPLLAIIDGRGVVVDYSSCRSQRNLQFARHTRTIHRYQDENQNGMLINTASIT
jgi:hypothetical protein